LAGLVDRFYQLESLLIRDNLANASTAAGHALECVVCPGTPEEVISVVSGLTQRLAQHQIENTEQHDKVSIAVAFAKRFAY
ncbi:MAG TPA: hypothetical protein VNO21_20180, partial [Polyangiaceae bacterium]|nr:hypothetical protein [Polyangiaceae bacterium]